MQDNPLKYADLLHSTEIANLRIELILWRKNFLLFTVLCVVTLFQLQALFHAKC